MTDRELLEAAARAAPAEPVPNSVPLATLLESYAERLMEALAVYGDHQRRHDRP